MSVLAEVQEIEEIGQLREFVLNRLERHERLVLMLVYAERLTFAQVGQVLGTINATASARPR